MSVFDNYLLDNFNSSKDSYSTVFDLFDRNRDGFLDEEELRELLQDLFHNVENSGNTSAITPSLVSSLITVLDLDKILKPVRALIIVDVQNDFISGSLALHQCPAAHDASVVVPVINKMLDDDIFDVVVYTYDWHPDNHISFIENVKQRNIHSSSKATCDCAKVGEPIVFDMDQSKQEQILWPKHCIQNSWGSELHRDLKVVPEGIHVKKGTHPDIDSYSAFWDNEKMSQTELSSLLGERKVTDVYVCGLAYDVCVGFTALQAVEHGFRTVLIEDASRGVTHDGIAKKREEMVAKGIYMANSDQVPSIARCELRPIGMSMQAAINYKVAWEIVKNKKSAAESSA